MQSDNEQPPRPKPPFRELWPANARRPILGFAAYSGTGKTTLLRALIPLLVDKGIRPALVKHAHHAFDVDKPGKDSYELRKAGAGQVLVTSANRRALMMEKAQPKDPVLDDELCYLDQRGIDLILVEGFKHERFPKIELRRADADHPYLSPMDETIIAIASDSPVDGTSAVPQLDINSPNAIASFILREVLAHEHE